MKKNLFFVIALATMLATSCSITNGATKDITNNPYVEDGYGRSVNKDKAYQIAYNNAVQKLTSKFDANTNSTTSEKYVSSQRGTGVNESLETTMLSTTKSRAHLTDVVVTSKKIKRRGTYYECTVVVKVDPSNIEHVK